MRRGGRDPLGQAQVRLRRAATTCPLRVEPVHLQDRRDAGQARQRHGRGVAGDEVERHVGPLARGDVGGAHQRVRERVEVLVADRRQVHQARAGVLVPALGHVGAAVDRHLVAAGREALRQALDRGLEAAVRGGDAARAGHRDPHAASRAAAHAARPMPSWV